MNIPSAISCTNAPPSAAGSNLELDSTQHSRWESLHSPTFPRPISSVVPPKCPRRQVSIIKTERVVVDQLTVLLSKHETKICHSDWLVLPSLQTASWPPDKISFYYSMASPPPKAILNHPCLCGQGTPSRFPRTWECAAFCGEVWNYSPTTLQDWSSQSWVVHSFIYFNIKIYKLNSAGTRN